MPRKVASTKKIKTSEVTIQTVNIAGKAGSQMVLPRELFDTTVNEPLIAQAIRQYQANQHQGTRSTKTRSEVSGSTRKIYRQKGTGRARHGDIKAPIFVGGGIAHGPKPSFKKLELSKRMRQKALASALTKRLRAGHITVIDGEENIGGKTKEVVLAVKNIRRKKEIIMILPKKNEILERATRNLSYLTLQYAKMISPQDILRFEQVVFLKSSIPVLEQTFIKKKISETEKKPELEKPKISKPRVKRLKQASPVVKSSDKKVQKKVQKKD